MKSIIPTLILFISLTSCEKAKETKVIKEDTTIQKIHLGQKLLEENCFLCHNPKASENERIAPPMVAIKAHYITPTTTKEAFIKKFSHFVTKPSQDKVELKGAFRRFGLMPYQAYKEEDVKLIAEYLFNYQIEEPTWFKEHWLDHGKPMYVNTGKKSVLNQAKTKAEIGLSYALETKKVLGKNLMGTLKKEGTLTALSFCNEKAYTLTDSMSTKFNAIIKRVSDKPRNQQNKANDTEITIINQYKKALANKESLKGIVQEKNGKTQFYYPIVTNSMCLKCHGNSETDIKSNVLTKIKELYPEDKAQGYTENQIRGIWNVIFDDNN